MEACARTRVLVVALAAAGLPLTGRAQTSPDGVWTAAPLAAADRAAARGSGPGGQAVRLDRVRLAAALTQSDANTPPSITLPLPDGAFAAFTVEPVAVMEPELQAKLPGLATYRGDEVGGGGRTARFEVDESGLTAVIFAEAGEAFVRPLPLAGGLHLSSVEPAARGACEVRTPRDLGRAEPVALPSLAGPRDHRTYRLAIGATPAYTQYFGGTVDGALHAIVRTVNHVSEVYERELAIRFVLVADEDRLIEVRQEKTSYAADQRPSTLLAQNQLKLDALLGPDGYDIGHVVATGSGGLATLATTCIEGVKARGMTGRADPVGPGFDIDYVAHEIGHQLGANHTFNGSSDSCGGANRNAATAYEPGSGTTIMAYAGICGGENLAEHSDDYFHAVSLGEIMAYTRQGAGSACGEAAAGPAAAPELVIAGGPRFLVPRGTPFVLQVDPPAESGRIRYTWDEVDLGEPGPPNDDRDGRERPLFRSLRSGEGRRHFAGQGTLGAALPSAARVLNFRILARYERPGGGSWSAADATVEVKPTGPFRVLEPSAASPWTSSGRVALRWDVGGSSAPPFSLDMVEVWLSTDGGASFTRKLAEVPNTGQAELDAPDLRPGAARVELRPRGAIFYARSEAFTVKADAAQDAAAREVAGVPRP